MGKVGLTPLQATVFTEFLKEKISSQFYFTGGTALSTCYLFHRESEDLDFFSESDFDNNEILAFLETLSAKMNTTYRLTQRGKVRITE